MKALLRTPRLSCRTKRRRHYDSEPIFHRQVHDDLEENLTAEVGGQWVAVFDGIGGLPDGAQASRSAVQTLLTAFRGNPQAAPSYLYQQTIDWMDRAVAEQTAGGGSTIVSVWARGDGLY